MDVERFLEAVRRYTYATKITQHMVTELIDHIDVYPKEKQDGITMQRVVIFHNRIGAFSAPDRLGTSEVDVLMETRRGIALCYDLVEMTVQGVFQVSKPKGFVYCRVATKEQLSLEKQETTPRFPMKMKNAECPQRILRSYKDAPLGPSVRNGLDKSSIIPAANVHIPGYFSEIFVFSRLRRAGDRAEPHDAGEAALQSIFLPPR